MEVMFCQKNHNNYFANKNIIGFFGEIGDLQVLVNNIENSKININKRVKHIVKKNIDFIKPFGWDETILNKKICDLSETNYKELLLIEAILKKPELIILNNFDIGISEKTLNRIIRFIKTINCTFNIKFIVITKDIKFANKLIKDIIIMKNQIIKYQGKLLPAIKQNLIEKPEIIKFIDLANKKGAKLDYTLEEKELLKSIYRSVA